MAQSPVGKEELRDWLDRIETEYFIELLNEEVQRVREKYDTISGGGLEAFKKTQGQVNGLQRAISLAKNIVDTED